MICPPLQGPGLNSYTSACFCLVVITFCSLWSPSFYLIQVNANSVTEGFRYLKIQVRPGLHRSPLWIHHCSFVSSLPSTFTVDYHKTSAFLIFCLIVITYLFLWVTLILLYMPILICKQAAYTHYHENLMFCSQASQVPASPTWSLELRQFGIKRNHLLFNRTRRKAH